MWRRAFIPPKLVVGFLLCDLAFASAYTLTSAWGHFDEIFDMSKENNLPTWYSSLQYTVSAAFFGIFAWLNVRRGDRRSWVLLFLPLLCTLLSMDEDASVHERLGPLLDSVILGHTRQASALPRTGVWFILGIPFLISTYIGMRAAYHYFASVPRAFVRCCSGFGLIVFAAAGLEAVSNYIGILNTEAYFLETLAEETLELLGSTLVLWSAVELLNAVGIRVEATKPLAHVQAANDGGYLQPRPLSIPERG